MMPFIEIMFCGLATSIFPFSWYWGGRTRLCWGVWGTLSTPCRATSTAPCLPPPLHAQLCHPQAFWGPSCPPKCLLPGAECSGYHGVQSCIIKPPWLFASETFTVPCSAGKDDCSKPKLGINYTTTLHFSFTKQNCVARAVQAPPPQRPLPCRD